MLTWSRASIDLKQISECWKKKQLLTWKKRVDLKKEASIGFEKRSEYWLGLEWFKRVTNLKNILKVTNLKMFRKIKSLIVFWKFSKSYDKVKEVTTGQVKVYFKSVFYANLRKKTISKCWLE